MATIYRLVTQLAADPAPMEAGFARGLQLVERYATAATAALQKIAPSGTSTSAAESGAAVASTFVNSLEKSFREQEGHLREAFARGTLSRAAWEEKGKENSKAFNDSLLNGIAGIRAEATANGTIVPNELFTDLQSRLKEEGIKSSDAFTNSFTTIGEKFRSLGRDLTQTGRELTIALTVPITAAALAGVASAETFNHAIDEIAVTTGKTGPAFEAMAASLRRIFDALPNSAEDIAKALEVISTNSGVAGGQLDKLATQVLNLSRITGTDLRGNVESTQHAFVQFGIAAADQERALNTLFRTSQLTGTTVQQLADTIAHFAPVLHAVGLSFGESAALVGSFAKSGIEVDGVLTSLQTSLARFAERGVDGVHAIDIIINDIKNASTTAKAIDLATDIFGPRQAAQLADAIRSGKLDIESLANLVRATAVDINGLAGETDKFGVALNDLRHHLTDSSAILGQQFEQVIVALAPAMIAIADKLVELAKGFNSLRPSVQIAIGAFVFLLAAIGPALLLLGGLSKAIGATALAVGILRAGLANFSLAPLAASAVAAGEGLSTAAAAAATFAAAMRLVLVSVGIGAALFGIVLIFDALTESAERANKQVDEFRLKIAALDATQLKLQDDSISQQIQDKVDAIDRLKRKMTELNDQHALTPKMLRDMSAVIRDDEDAISVLERDLNSVSAAEKKISDEASTATVKIDAFTKAVNSLITEGGTGAIKIDAVGHITASVDVLKAHIKSLQELIEHPAELGDIKIDVAEAALRQLQLALTRTQDASTSIPSIIDRLHISAKNTAEEVARLVARIQDLGPTAVQQLGNVKLNDDVLAKIVRVNEELAKLPAFANLDRQALEGAQKALQGLAAIQITQNLPATSDVKVSVTGVIKRLEPDVSAAGSAKFISLEVAGLEKIKEAAENASAASARLQEALDTHASQDAIIAAQNAVTQSYAKLRTQEIDFRTQVNLTRKSLSDRNAVLALIGPTVAITGANVAEVKPDATTADTTDFLKKLQAQLDALPGLNINLVPVEDFKGLHDVAVRIGQEVQAAQLQALAGNAGAARAQQQRLLNELTKRVQDTAKDTSPTGRAQASVAFQQIEEAAKRANIPIADILKHMKDLTVLGQAVRIADAFKAAADAAFGANSAVAAMAGGIDEAVKAAQLLKETLATIKAGGSLGDNLGDLVSGITQGITGLVSVVQGIIGTIHSLFGKSQLDIEHDTITKNNTDAIRSLNETIGAGADRIARASEAIAEVGTKHFDDLVAAFERQNGFNVADPSAATKSAFDSILHDFGLTMDDAIAVAKQFNITLLDSKGNLVGLSDLGKALEAEAKILTTLGGDFSTQQAKIAAENAIAGKTTGDAAQVLSDQLLAIARTAPDIGATLQAASLHGADALRKALNDLLASIENGTVGLDQLHGFKDVNELLAAITSTADDLNKLGATAAGVTETLVGVPQGFKKALAEFNATAAQAAFQSQLPTGIQPPKPTDTTPTRPPDPGVLLDLAKQLTAAVKAQVTPATTPPPAPPPLADVSGAGKSLSNVLDTLKSLTTASTGTTKSVSDVKDAFLSVPVSVAGTSKSLAEFASQLGLALPSAAKQATTAISGILSGLANATVTVPTPLFHVERSPTITLPAPPIKVTPIPPITLEPPSITFGQFSAITVAAPPVTVAPFTAITLAPPPITILPFAPIALVPPVVSVGAIKPVIARPPTVTLASAIPTVSAAPPRVSLSRQLATLVVGPPPVTVSPYKSNVALSPPPVSVRQFPTVMLAAPAVSVAKPGTVSMAAPSFHVQPFASVRLNGPPVEIVPYKPITLAPPKVKIDPLPPIKQPAVPLPRDPVSAFPADPKDVSSTAADRRLLAQLVAILTEQQANAQPTQAGDTIFTGDINIDAQKQTRKEIFEAAKAEAQSVARARTGSSTNVLSAFQQ